MYNLQLQSFNNKTKIQTFNLSHCESFKSCTINLSNSTFAISSPHPSYTLIYVASHKQYGLIFIHVSKFFINVQLQRCILKSLGCLLLTPGIVHLLYLAMSKTYDGKWLLARFTRQTMDDQYVT